MNQGGTMFVIKCPECQWDKFQIHSQEKQGDTVKLYCECNRCGKELETTLTDGEIRFNYAKRVTGEK